MPYRVKDIRLASEGEKKVDFAREHMKPLMAVSERFKRTKPFKNLSIGMALHVTKETAVLVETLEAGGARVAVASCNPLSTQDDVAASLAKKGTDVYAYKGENSSDYYAFIRAVIAAKPQLTIDDGCDLVSEIHLKHKNLIPAIIGGCEETTTGIHRLRSMEREGALKYPIVAVNDNKTKHLFDNFYGTGQSTWDGILRATNILVAGKTVVVAGYGDCSRGIALRARGLGAHVIVTEIDPVRALQATMDGYWAMPMNEASAVGDIFVTATGGKHAISLSHIKKMKSGAILANSGHFNVEIDVEGLEKIAARKKTIRPFLQEFTIKNRKAEKNVFLIAEGRLVNLASAEGHPSEVMALSFCGQAMACEWLVKMATKKPKLLPSVHLLPEEIDTEIALLALKTLGIEIDTLSAEQQKYQNSWREGT